MIKINKALQKTMQDFGIKGVWLAERTGISNNAISTYLVGRGEMKTDNLEKLIEGLPFEARDYFFKLLHPRTTDIEAFLQEATQEEKAEVLRLVAASLEKTPNPPKTGLAGSREVMPV